MARSRTALTIRFLAVDLVGSFLYFPVWWYTAGALRTAVFCATKVRDAARAFGIAVWFKNLFVPMFGQHDVQGRIISFFMRAVAIVFYSVVLLLLSVVMTAVFLAWLILPLLVLYEIGVQYVGLTTGQV